MRIRWVNHASFVLEHGAVRLLSDPWLFGSAFADSWDLLAPTRFGPADFSTITHIWVSHEHPDHFSPPSLRSIPEEDRRRIVLMTQRTRDRRVAGFCRGLGFADVIELPSGEWCELGADVRVMCQPVKLDDSWLAIRAGDETVLNLNDCLLTSEPELQGVMAQVGRPVDVLLTQFSFAAWIGNPTDVASHRLSGQIARERILLQTQHLAPRWVVPCASYCWFSHEENAFMNGAMNRVEDIVAELRRETAAVPVVLYPGDEWTPGSASADELTQRAQAAYAADIASLPDRSVHEARPRTIEELQDLGGKYASQLMGFHGPLLRFLAASGRLPATPIWLQDKGRAVALSAHGIGVAALGYGECDIAMSSDALALMLQQMWGGMTLVISGRFEVPSGGDISVGGPPRRFLRFVELADNVNHGWPLRREIMLRLSNVVPWRPRVDWGDRHTPDADRPLVP